MSTHICIQGASTHNLKKISLNIPKNRLVVITGPSGSGKSSLAFHTIHAEGQRRYLESLSTYARHILPDIKKPDVDSITGLPPTIAIGQSMPPANPRSTVGTISHIFDTLRLLFAQLGIQYCPIHEQPLQAETQAQMVDKIIALCNKKHYMLLAPLCCEQAGDHRAQFEMLRSQGFMRVCVNAEVMMLDPTPILNPKGKYSIELLVDRFTKPPSKQRLLESIQICDKVSKQGIMLREMNPKSTPASYRFSTTARCPECSEMAQTLTPKYFSFNTPEGACADCHGLGTHTNKMQTVQPCQSCQGTRLNTVSRYVLIQKKSITDIANYSMRKLLHYVTALHFAGQQNTIAMPILDSLKKRIQFLIDIGLDYLSCHQPVSALSGGELRRMQLARQIDSGLVGVLYILDEPSIGLHPKDNHRLLDSLKHLRDLGNTVLVVEHDRECIHQADYIIDIGPSAGQAGGHVTAAGTLHEISRVTSSSTAQYLSGQSSIAVPKRKQRNAQQYLSLMQASGHHLKSIDLNIPIGLINCITGASGSGKSTLIQKTLYPALANHLNKRTQKPTLPYQSLEHSGDIKRVIAIDQSSIGKTAYATPATYTGLLLTIRTLLSQTQTARSRGYTPGHFSFNSPLGRCASCRGYGVLNVQMHFLPDIEVLCDDCHGLRYRPEILDICYKGHNIAQILSMSLDQASQFFQAVPSMYHKLKQLQAVGLGYLLLGQSALSLSGGEAQRIKLARALSRSQQSSTLYIFDEPTTGLHFQEIAQLIELFYQLRAEGNTLIVIEHNLDVIKTADWIIDLGPGGGDQGGYILAEGTPEQLVQQKASITAPYLIPLFNRKQT